MQDGMALVLTFLVLSAAVVVGADESAYHGLVGASSADRKDELWYDFGEGGSRHLRSRSSWKKNNKSNRKNKKAKKNKAKNKKNKKNKKNNNNNNKGDKDSCRASAVYGLQKELAELNYFALLDMQSTQRHPLTNGDETSKLLVDDFKYIGNFHKTLPHNALGEVDAAAYESMVTDCIEEEDFSGCSRVPGGSGDGTFPLANPMGCMYIPAQGMLPLASNMPAPPSVTSAKLATMWTETAWMALLRDVPFSEYSTDPMARKAADGLACMPGYIDDNTNWRPAMINGAIDPTHLFRYSVQGGLDGPAVSQFLLHPFTMDGITVDPKITTAMPNNDYMTTVESWLNVQNGGDQSGNYFETDPVRRYPRNARDLATIAISDQVTSGYVRAANIAGMQPGRLTEPYAEETRQVGFVTGGLARFIAQINGAAGAAGPHAWRNKWNVHRLLRPEAFGGLVHMTMTSAKEYPLHDSLLHSNSTVLRELHAKWGTYLLPQVNGGGSPTHPSYPAGHGVFAGACVTVLKAYLDPTGDRCFPNEILVSSPDGESLETYTGTVSGSCVNDEDGTQEASRLTITGELNKLAHNIVAGREMLGVHYRCDGVEGMKLGEEVAMAYLQDELDRQPECSGAHYRFRAFDGENVTISRRTRCDAFEACN